MIRAMNLKEVERSTGKSWNEWFKFLDGVQARSFSHKEIAKKLGEQRGVTNWWAQTIAVAYEQHIDRRRPGQSSDGKYQVTVSKTVDGTLDEALEKWLRVVAGRQDFSRVPVARTRTTGSSKFRYWRCGLVDGSRVNVGISQKAPGKAVIAVGHENLTSLKQVDRWRSFWKSLLATVPS